MSSHTTSAPAPAHRTIRGALVRRIRLLRAHPVLSLPALEEGWRAWRGGYPADQEHEAHLRGAIDWLVRAQDATPDGGIARGFSLTRHPNFGARGWQPSYPETTGYIIPTLYAAARRLARPDLAARAERAARWEIEVQLASGAARSGVIGAPECPAAFNTGQVILGWLSAWEETGRNDFAEAACRAARYLTATLGADGCWRDGLPSHARTDSTLYHARAAWALAEAGDRLGDATFSAAGTRALRAAARLQTANGWLPQCCLSDPAQPLLHTLAYAVRGLLEGGRVLGEWSLIYVAERTAARLADSVRSDGWMPGRYRADWSPAVGWSCLTGQAQMANNWMRLAEVTGETRWLDPVPAVLGFLKRTQNRESQVSGVRGGIAGSWPVGGAYAAYELLNWATKFFADALMRHEAVVANGPGGVSPVSSLA